MKKSIKVLAMLGIIGLFLFTLESGLDTLKESRFKEELSKNYEKIELPIEYDKDIVFDGYGYNGCFPFESKDKSIKFYHYLSSTDYPAIAYHIDGVFHVAKYIKKYTTKEEVSDYLITCTNQIKLSEERKAEKIKENEKTWE